MAFLGRPEPWNAIVLGPLPLAQFRARETLAQPFCCFAVRRRSPDLVAARTSRRPLRSIMRYRPLGNSGLFVSEVSFGAGPVSGLMTHASWERQLAVLSRAVDLGVNWIDTAAGYGNGRSEENLGRILQAVPAKHDRPLHVATKVRLQLRDETDLRPLVIASVRESLRRLQLPRVTLLQVHNALTPRRNDEPTSITPEDVLGAQGILAAFEELRAEGMVAYFGLTGIGHPDSMRAVLRSGQFSTIQIPFHVLNPSALLAMPAGCHESNYGQVISEARRQEMGVFAIRIFAAGALLNAPPSAHTLQTPFFPLPLYERDRALSARLHEALGAEMSRLEMSMAEFALRFVLSHAEITSAILGFGEVEHVDAAVRSSGKGGLPEDLLAKIATFLAQET